MGNKVVILVLAADGKYQPLVDGIKATWGKNDSCEVLYCWGYMKDRPRPDPGEALEDGDDIICGFEETLENIPLKNVVAMEHVLRTRNPDYLFRCCCGGYVHPPNLLKFLENKPKNNFYCGVIGEGTGEKEQGIIFASGSGFFISNDLLRLLVRNKHELMSRTLMDDVAIGKFLTGRGVYIVPGRRLDVDIVSIHGEVSNDHYHYHFRLHDNLMYKFHRKLLTSAGARRPISTLTLQRLLAYALSGESLRKHCNQAYRPTAYDNSITNPMGDGVVFVKGDYLEEFLSKYPNNRFVLVSHNSDREIDSPLVDSSINVVKWYAQNAIGTSRKLIPLPIGLENSYCDTSSKTGDIFKVLSYSCPEKLLYMNHRVNTFPSERGPLWDKFKALDADWVTVQEPVNGQNGLQGYLNDLSEHKFILCPRGNGVDTHRMWEAIYCGVVPVVRYEPAHRNFTDLPILFVNSWDEVTEEFLQEAWVKMLDRSYNLNKLRADYWGWEFVTAKLDCVP